jgi:hypothetical protein
MKMIESNVSKVEKPSEWLKIYAWPLNNKRITFLLSCSKNYSSWAPVVHTYNPSYSGGRYQEDHSLKPAQANSLWDPILKNPSQKSAGGVAQGVGSKFKPQCHKKPPIKQNPKTPKLQQTELLRANFMRNVKHWQAHLTP